MKCKWEEIELPDNRGWRRVRCSNCGFVTGKTPHVFSAIHRGCTKVGLGDYVAAGIEATGLGAAYRWIRGGKKCGGCGQRQEALNELGKKVGL